MHLYITSQKKILVKLMTLFLLLLLTSNQVVFAAGDTAESDVSISIEDTASNVNKVKSLAQSLRNDSRNSSAKTNGGFSWDTEGKSRSWTYYNGIMMDAFLMMDEYLDTDYTTYVNAFYNTNISSSLAKQGNKYTLDSSTNTKVSYGYVNDSISNDNYYRPNELDSIPPTRAMFDLLKGNVTSDQKKRYTEMIYYVYDLLQNYVKVEGKIFKHKYNNNNWNEYQVGLDGLYMGQPFLLEVANCLEMDNSPLDANRIGASADSIYTSVYDSLVWVDSKMYNAESHLYHHGWGSDVGGNGHYWLRGIGWYAAALTDAICMLPDSHVSERDHLISIAQKLFDGMMLYQDSSTGMWRNVVNQSYDLHNPSNNNHNEFESSGSALMAYAMMKLYAGEYIGEVYGEAGLQAFNGVVANKINSSGELTDVYRQSGVEKTDEGYLTSTYETNEAKGVGPLMMAACYANGVADKLQKPDPVNPTVTAPTAVENLVYNGDEQTLVEDGSATGGTMYYCLGDNDTTAPMDDGENAAWTTTPPSAKDAGTYYVWYKVKGDRGYKDTEPQAITVAISPKPVKITGLRAKDKVYDGTVEASITGTPQLEEVKKTGIFGFFSSRLSGGAVEEGDDLAVDYGTASFEDASVGEDKTVTFEGFTLSGVSAPNYELNKQPESTKASITSRKLTIAAKDQTINNGENIDTSSESYQIAEGSLVDGQSIRSVTLTANGSEIEPSDAVIKNGDDTDMTGNYAVTYQKGALTVINSYTVTFKVVNGAWNDETAEDKTVTVSGSSDDERKLNPEDIPAAGEKPAEGYQAGSWDLTPSADTPITEDTTYIYTYSEIEEVPHEHSFSDEWTSDAATHWHACLTEGCDQKGDEAAHSFDTDGKCTVCGYEKKETSPQGSVTITGLEDSDTVKLYKVIGWESSSGWNLLDPFTDIDPWAAELAAGHEIQINDTIVNELNSRITGTTQAVGTSSQHPSDGTYTADDLEPGMYIAIVTAGVSADPSVTGTIYNPIIVSTDFVKDGSVDAPTSSIPIANASEHGGNTAIAKKASLTLEKSAQDANDHDGNAEETVAVGDEITFTLTTEIPPYAIYQHPSFVITDQMSKGLKYTKGSVNVTAPAGLTKGNQYEVTNESDEGPSGYTLSFKENYLKTIAANTPVTITYKATVTTEAIHSVNHEINTATLEFANDPNGTGKGTLKDRTNHYTFDIDADLLGHTDYEATEIVKVGVDASGNEIKETKTLSNQGTVGALQGAEFALYKAKESEVSGGSWEKVGSDPVIPKIISGPDGRLKMTGLDAGKYLLEETKAPAGYIKNPDPVKIEIAAQVEPKTYVENGCKIETEELVSYTVTVNGQQTASYTITNDSKPYDPEATSASQGDTVVGIDGDKGKIKNTQGVELPSTGGPGTTQIYLFGLLLMVVGGFGLLTLKKRETL